MLIVMSAVWFLRLIDMRSMMIMFAMDFGVVICEVDVATCFICLSVDTVKRTVTIRCRTA